jgi:hypothetical protein
MPELKSTPAQLRAYAKYRAANKEAHSVTMKAYYQLNKTELLRKKRERYHRLKAERSAVPQEENML